VAAERVSLRPGRAGRRRVDDRRSIPGIGDGGRLWRWRMRAIVVWVRCRAAGAALGRALVPALARSATCFGFPGTYPPTAHYLLERRSPRR
jgi:hypothetical protein